MRSKFKAASTVTLWGHKLISSKASERGNERIDVFNFEEVEAVVIV